MRDQKHSMDAARPRRWVAEICGTILVSAAVLLVPVPGALPDSYHDFLCRIPYGPNAGAPAPADDVGYTINGSFVFAGDGCAGGGSLYAAIDGQVPHPYGAAGVTTFNAPAGITIAGFTIWRYEADGPSQPYGSPASNLLYAPGPPSVQGLCTQSLGCSERGTPQSPLSSANAVSVGSLSGVTQIQWSAACGGGPGGECPASGGTFSSLYEVYAADIDLVDDTPPSVTGVSGPLVSGATLSGPQSISFTASDAQSGVYGGSLIVDGHPVVSQILDTNGGACVSLGLTADGQRSFEHAQPCKSTVSASLTLQTNELPAGQHSLQLVVEDAAGNHTIAYDATITTAGPPAGGQHLPNGQPCAGAALSLTINGKPRPPVVPYGAPVTIAGLLHCGVVPIGEADVAIAALGGPALAGTVQTSSSGSFVYRVPTGPDRRLQLSYTAYSDEQSPAASAIATIMVRPQIKLRIAPRRTSNGHTIHWAGVIAEGPFPRHGVTLDVEVREGRLWRIFNQIVSNKKGQFHYSYRFHATEQPTTYAFRVALPDNGAQGYPYTAGASNTVDVHVDP